MSEHKNTIIAIALSAIVLLAWQYFVTGPQQKAAEERQRSQQQLTQQQATPPNQPNQNVQAPQGPVPSGPPGQIGQSPAAAVESRDDALKASQRIPIQTDTLQGSIAL